MNDNKHVNAKIIIEKVAQNSMKVRITWNFTFFKALFVIQKQLIDTDEFYIKIDLTNPYFEFWIIHNKAKKKKRKMAAISGRVS